VSKIDEFLNGQDAFLCSRFNTRMLKKRCVERQQKRHNFPGEELQSWEECEDCIQGRLIKNAMDKAMQTPSPARGEGEKNPDCDLYQDCLDLAAKGKWAAFNCEDCPFYYAPDREGKNTATKAGEGVRTCEECGERKTISPKHSLCPSCMAKRSSAAQKAKKTVPGKPKTKTRDNAKAKPEKPLQGQNEARTINFGKYGSILREVEKLAEEEMRPVDLQVIYMLKNYLNNEKEDRAT